MSSVVSTHADRQSGWSQVCVSDGAIDRGNAYTNDGGLAPSGSSELDKRQRSVSVHPGWAASTPTGCKHSDDIPSANCPLRSGFATGRRTGMRSVQAVLPGVVSDSALLAVARQRGSETSSSGWVTRRGVLAASSCTTWKTSIDPRSQGLLQIFARGCDRSYDPARDARRVSDARRSRIAAHRDQDDAGARREEPRCLLQEVEGVPPLP